MKHYRILGLLILIFSLVGCNQTAQIDHVAPSHIQEEVSFSITDFSDRTITFEQKPVNIVALGNGEVDIIYELGGEVVGRPTTNGPPPRDEVKDIKEVGSTHGINLEIITSLKADIVLGNDPMNLDDIPAIENIGAQMILTRANSIDEIKKQVDLFGDILQKEEKAQEIIHTIDEKVNALTNNQQEEKIRVLLIYGAPGSNLIALPNSLSGNILELAGGVNIASDYPKLEAYPQYAQLNAEKVIESNPQLILFMGHGDPAVKDHFIEEMNKYPGWEKLEAVQNEQFEILPPDLFGTNPGTRVVEALDYLDKLFQEIQ